MIEKKKNVTDYKLFVMKLDFILEMAYSKYSLVNILAK